MKTDRMRIVLFVVVFLLLNGTAASQAASLSTQSTLFHRTGVSDFVSQDENQPTASPTSQPPSQPPPPSTPTPEPVFTAVIPPTGGVLAADDGTTIRLLNGAVLGNTVISYTRCALNQAPELPEGMELRAAFDLSAEDQLTRVEAAQFNPPVIVAIRHDLSGHAEFSDGLALYYRDGDRWATDGITLVGLDSQVITHTTCHFASFVLMEKKHRASEQDSETR